MRDALERADRAALRSSAPPMNCVSCSSGWRLA